MFAEANASENLVCYRNISKSYGGGVMAVRDLDLEVRKGEFLTLLGPSGSGKTTTLMMLAGFEEPTVGEILLRGRPITHLLPQDRNIGVVFQNYALFPNMTVAGNVGFPLRVRGVGRAEIDDRVARATAMVRLSGYEHRKPSALSGGQQQRVALARALVFEPDLVLMDEPLGALDKQLREQMQLEIRQLHHDLNLTLVYVTHDQAEALTMSDRIAVFNGGAVQQVAAPKTIYDRPDTTFVARFVGDNNSIDGHVASMGGGVCGVEVSDGSIIRATPVAVDAVGDRTTLSVRPEQVVWNPAADSLANVFHARVLELVYVGLHTRVVLSLCGRDDFVTMVPATSGLTLNPGMTCSVGWSAESCLALDFLEDSEQPSKC